MVSTFSHRTLVLISGPLGGGKTKLVETILRELGFTGVSSPTFTLHQVYEVKGRAAVDHFDLYRVESESDLESSGLFEALEAPTGLVLVEWADRLPKNFRAPGWQVLRVTIGRKGEDREISIR